MTLFQAAIALQIEVALYNRHRESCGYDPVKIGISLHTGRLMLGIIGEDKRLEGTVISDAVNLASRLESLTKLYGASVIASESTMEGLRDAERYKHRYLDEVRVRGREHSIKLYEIYDGLSDSFVETREKTKPLFAEALSLYQNGRLAEAGQILQQVQNLDREDRAAQVFMRRIEHFEQNGLPEGWDGVQEFAH